MHKVAVEGVRQARIVDVPDPTPEGDWVVVRVHAAPLCTEYKGYLSGQAGADLGHEAAGEVVATAQATRVRVGERVVAMPLTGCGRCRLCQSGQYIYCEHRPVRPDATLAQYIVKPSWLLQPIPDDLPYERAALACCGLGPSFGAFQRAGLGAHDTVLITGAGPVGLGALVNARFRGARAIVVEGAPWRAERARQMGALAVLDPVAEDTPDRIRALTDGVGVDVALDCAGAVAAQRLCLDATRRRGTVAFVGECHEALEVRASPDLLRKGLTLLGSWHYLLQDYPLILRVIRQSPLIDLLISHVLPLESVAEAFELQAAGRCAKVILSP
jgi:L-iditol 2-dehydrogenase